MISVAIIILVYAAVGENAVNVSRGFYTINGLQASSLDIKIEVKPNTLKNYLGDSKTDLLYRNERNSIPEGCKNFIGTSKPSLCFLFPSTKSAEVLNTYPRSCREIQKNGNIKSGIYKIKPRASSKPFAVLCDMVIQGGGWTHIQKRYDGSQDFDKLWRDYKFGFGHLEREFWLGLENIYQMTAFEPSELLVEVTDGINKTGYAHYGSFAITGEKDGYRLNVLSGYSGTAGDSLIEHLNSQFSTSDVDQDQNPSGSCAIMFEGAWWYRNCHDSCLNGKYQNLVLLSSLKYHGIMWSSFRGKEYNLSGSRMMVRPIRI
ncbi:unnamed protein product [Diabrotica balteata]|uniref:Fibrinogen C-terminal domain-containing protein n=1 Tax=Diabrotica balteata TaxID=107213 RepID=A0A9N9T3Q1_DIABA|nr:unnamed protein product [Diabrotica balteata]